MNRPDLYTLDITIDELEQHAKIIIGPYMDAYNKIDRCRICPSSWYKKGILKMISTINVPYEEHIENI